MRNHACTRGTFPLLALSLQAVRLHVYAMPYNTYYVRDRDDDVFLFLRSASDIKSVSWHSGCAMGSSESSVSGDSEEEPDGWCRLAVSLQIYLRQRHKRSWEAWLRHAARERDISRQNPYYWVYPDIEPPQAARAALTVMSASTNTSASRADRNELTNERRAPMFFLRNRLQ